MLLDNRKELMNYRLKMAKERLHSSKILLDNGSYTDSIGRSYYADFFIVSMQDGKEQYERAEEFLEAIEKYLAENY